MGGRRELEFWATKGGKWSLVLEENGAGRFDIREFKHSNQQAASCNIQTREQAEARRAEIVRDAENIDGIRYKRLR